MADDVKNTGGQDAAQGDQGQQGSQNQSEKTFSQQDLDRIVQDRLARERQKFSDYDDLQKFKSEHQKQIEQQQQRTLEEQKEYEKLKETWSQKENEYKSLVSEREQQITGMKIDNALTNAVMKFNAYPEAAKLVRENAVVGDDGKVYIKGKDSNGMEANLNVDDGIKQFLADRQYLVRADGRGGAGTGPTNLPGGDDNQRDLAQELQQARYSGDRKKAEEIKAKIREKHARQRIVNVF